MSPTIQVPAVGWYLENTTPGHSKYYLITVTDSGVVTLSWGRIGTRGQCKVQKFPTFDDAQDVAMRQLYAKASKGYRKVHSDIKFTIDLDALERVCTNQAADEITRQFWAAQRQPQFDGDRQAVLIHYDQFVEKAQTLMNNATSMPFEAVYNDFEELEKAWTEIDERHSSASTTIELTRKMLHQALLNGGL